MKQFLLSLWLVIAIVTQSFITIADSTIDLETAASHQQSEHAHQIEHHDTHHQANINKTISTSTENSDNDQLTVIAEHDGHSDCHHCGHCTTPHVIWQINDLLLAVVSHNENNFPIKNITLSGVFDNTYRPPIA